jgi:DNA-binding TFAR19-related protein (PDSD5 family)
MSDEEDTEELRKAQLQRELSERKLAGQALDEEEFSQHQRRAEKAEYLRQKLEERAESETQGD